MKYVDVYDDIKDKIKNGIYSPWSSLEGEEILSDRYGISRTTIRKAITKLKQEGYLHSRQGSGIFVNPPEFYQEKNLRTLSERIEKSENIVNIVLDFNIVEADQNLAEVFNLPLLSKLFYYRRLRLINNSPKVIEETYMPYYLFKDFNVEKLQSSVLKYIESECNYVISHDSKMITAISIDNELSRLLNIKEGTATLQIHHKVYLMKSILAQYTKEVQTTNSIRFVSVR